MKSPKEQAEAYAKESWSPIKDHPAGIKETAFLAGWAARGQADVEAIHEFGCKAQLPWATTMEAKVKALDEETE